jgi:hypothetical protein
MLGVGVYRRLVLLLCIFLVSVHKQQAKAKQKRILRKSTKAKMQFIYQILLMCLCTFIGVMHAIPNPVALPHPEPELAIEERQLPTQGGPVDVSISFFHPLYDSPLPISLLDQNPKMLTAKLQTGLPLLLPPQPRNRRYHLLEQHLGAMERRRFRYYRLLQVQHVHSERVLYFVFRG